ncbi:MAG: metal-dependent hydrolase [Magnetococcales bacterium]|nr:metal-dependent hydrolase [Magnetococcales bacterium]
MAGFNTHVAVAAVIGGVGVATLMVAGLADPQTGLVGFIAATIGGVLPDVDAEDSWPLDLAFTLFALLGSFFIMFSQVPVYSIVELTVLWMVSFLFIKLAVCEMFVRFTVHRGIFHSLPAGVFFAGLTALLLMRLFHQSERFAWMTGLFVLLGYLVHLLLDELYSLNLFGEGGVSASLGSAFKLSAPDGWATAAMYVAIFLVYYVTPGLPATLREIFTPATLDAILARLVPVGPWFGLPFLAQFPGSR